MVNEWARMKPKGALTLEHQMGIDHKPVRTVSTSATIILRHGEELRIMRWFRHYFDCFELEIDDGGWATFDELVDKVVHDLNFTKPEIWNTVGGYKDLKGNAQQARAW